MKTEVLRAKNLCKAENGVPVLEGVNFHIFPGEMVAVIGLQYSGKTMLAAILSGAERPDTGTLLVEDRQLQFSSIAEAQRAGIYCMNRELQLIRSMSIAENFFVVNGNNSGGVFSNRRHIALAREVLRRFDVDFDPRTKVRELPRTEQRKIELIKIALQKPKLIISAGDRDFDIRESKSFYKLYAKLLGMGISVLTISNKLDEVVFKCDRVYPMRDGIFGKSIPQAEYSREKLFRALTGQTLGPALEEGGKEADQAAEGGPELLAAKWLRTEKEAPEVSFHLHAGEILGLIIPDSAQARAVAYTLYGEKKAAGGGVYLRGQPLELRGPWDAIDRGIALIPDNVQANGVFDALSMRENISLLALAKEHRSFGVLPRRMADYMSRSVAEHYKIPCRRLGGQLQQSGLRSGERQKIAIARWAVMRQQIYIFLNPFTNADESLADDLAAILRELAAGGAGVLIISTGTYKLQQLCGRLVYGGEAPFSSYIQPL